MIEQAARTHELPTAMPQKNAAQWIEIFTHYLVTQRHIMVRTRGVTAKEGTVTRIDTDAVWVVGTHGASCQIPFVGIEEVAPVGEVTQPLDTLTARHIYEFAEFMARGKQLRIETADHLITRAEAPQLFLSGVTLADRFDDVRVCVHFKDITHVSSVTMDA